MKILLFMLQTALILSLCGCASMKGNEKEQSKPAPVVLGEFSATHDAAALTAAKNFAAAFERSIRLNDFQFLQSALSRTGGNRFNAAAFAKLRTEMLTVYGNFQKMEYITWLDQGKLRDYLWKISFSKTDGSGKKSSPREILFCVRVFCEKDKQPDVAGFFFRKF